MLNWQVCNKCRKGKGFSQTLSRYDAGWGCFAKEKAAQWGNGVIVLDDPPAGCLYKLEHAMAEAIYHGKQRSVC